MLPIYGLSFASRLWRRKLPTCVMYIVVEVDAVADAVLQTVTSRNHDSVLFVVLPSIWLKNAQMLTLQLLPASRSP